MASSLCRQVLVDDGLEFPTRLEAGRTLRILYELPLGMGFPLEPSRPLAYLILKYLHVIGAMVIMGTGAGMRKQDTRSPMNRAIGLGSVRKGVGHWRAERATAIALVPLTLWLVVSLVTLSGRDYTSFVAWLRMPISMVGMVLLLVALFYHMALGLQVIVEDYVHSAARFPALIAIRFGCFALATTGIAAMLRICFGD